MLVVVLVVVVVLLVVTNAASLLALAHLLRRSTHHPEPEARVAAVLDGAPAPAASSSATRRVISVEILNAVELAGTRGRWAGVAGSVAPGLVKRIVHDQTIKILRRQLTAEGVRADVRLHVIDAPQGRPRER